MTPKEEFELKKQQYDEIKEIAKGLVSLCIRDNTVIEDYHAENEYLTDKRMAQFNKDCVNNVYVILKYLSGVEGEDLKEQIKEGLKLEAKRVAHWDTPKYPDWFLNILPLTESEKAYIKEHPSDF